MNQDEKAPWEYKPDDDSPSLSDEPVGGLQARHRPKVSAKFSWEAPEFLEHHHGPGWYAGLVAATIVLAAIIYLVTRDYFATGVIIAAGIIVWIYAGHKPAKIQYEIDASGLNINGKSYPYDSYKSFTVAREDRLGSVNLIPLKRFKPPVAAFFDTKDEAKITETLGEYLPYEDRKMDAIDKLSRRLRL